jgi:hypothetical protein
MVDPVYKPYVVLVRNRRVDIAGPFASDGEALNWVAQWSRFTCDCRSIQIGLRDNDLSAFLADRPGNPAGLARLCEPIDLDRDAARDWASLNTHRFAGGFPSTPSTDVIEESANDVL